LFGNYPEEFWIEAISKPFSLVLIPSILATCTFAVKMGWANMRPNSLGRKELKVPSKICIFEMA
jgi:hypothetical protein